MDYIRPVLYTKSLTLYYKDTVAIDSVNLELFPGEIHALIGNHGEGKTLLCKALSRQIENDHGTIFVESSGGKESLEVVWNSPAIYDQLTIGENIVLGTQHGLGRIFTSESRMLKIAQEWLRSIDIDMSVLMPAYKLKVSDKIVLGILRRLYRNPKVLILDQALEGLTPKSMKKITGLLREHADAGNAVLWVTHKLDVVNWLADRLSIFRQGKIIFTEITTGLVRNNLIELCYSHMSEDTDESVMVKTKFHDMLFYMDAMLQKLPIPIIMLDGEDLVVYSNLAAREFLHESFKGVRNFFEIFSESGQERVVELLTEHKLLQENVNAKLPVVIRSQPYMLNVRIRFISDENPTGGRVVILEDVTDEEEMRERANLSANLSSLGMLAAGVSHEINNPLSIIENYASYLSSEVSGEDSVQAIKQIREEVQEIHRITNNLKAFSGNYSNGCEVFDLGELVSHLVDLLRFEVKKKGIKICWEAPDNEMAIKASRAEMRQVLLNIVNNSFDALKAEEDGEIRVSLNGSINSNMFVLEVEDNGTGIPFENPADIFLPFNSTKKSSGSNHGLGLSIVYNLIQRHQGTIVAENIEPHGCKFIISLPKYLKQL